MKHIIFTGKRGTGKSLFAKLIFNDENTLFIDGRNFRGDQNSYASCREVWDYEKVIVDDVNKNLNFLSLYSNIFLETMCVNRMHREPELVKTPLHIFIVDSISLKLNTDDASFRRRFNVIDFDKNTIADLTRLINDEKITINTFY